MSTPVTSEPAESTVPAAPTRLTVPTWETLELRQVGAVAVLALDRPQARNAIDSQMRTELGEAVTHVEQTQAYRALVLTGNGTAFCAGGDVKGMQERIDQGPRVGEIGWRRQRELHDTLRRLYDLDRPTLAAVNGPALGLGLDLALTCDFVWAASSARVGATFVRRGLVPDGGGLFHLPRRVGVSRAKELVYSGRDVDADEALHIGLVDRVLPGDDLLTAAVDFLDGLGEHPATAQAMAKTILNRTHELSLDEVNTLASQAQAFCYASPDHLDSVRGFLAARAPRASS